MSSVFLAVHGVKRCKIYLVPVINIDNSFKYCIVKIVNLLLLIKQMKHAISIYKQRSSFRSLLSSNIWQNSAQFTKLEKSILISSRCKVRYFVHTFVCVVKIVNLLLLIKQMKHAISIYKQRSSFRSSLSSNISQNSAQFIKLEKSILISSRCKVRYFVHTFVCIFSSFFICDIFIHPLQCFLGKLRKHIQRNKHKMVLLIMLTFSSLTQPKFSPTAWKI